jgi:hypothetical protein
MGAVRPTAEMQREILDRQLRIRRKHINLVLLDDLPLVDSRSGNLYAF